MGKYLKLISAATVFLLSIFIFTPHFSYALDSGSTICSPDQSQVGSGKNLSNCINNIYAISVAVAATISVIMLIIAGYMYMTGGEAVKKAKNMITAVITALLILFGTYALLNTINPDLTNVNGVILPDVQCDATHPCGSLIAQSGGGTTATGTPNGTGTSECPNCVDFGGDPYNLQTNGTVIGDPALAQKLINLKNASNGIPWYVTASYEPTGHISSCHSNGTCADIGAQGDSPQQLASLCSAMKSTGFTIVNEYSADPTVVASCGTYKVFDTTTGSNFHIY